MSYLHDMSTKILVDDITTRLRIAEECGIGFEQSSLVPSLPNSAADVDVDELAQLAESADVDLWI